MPSKSAFFSALVGAPLPVALVNCCWGEPAPNIATMSLLVFSASMSASENAPTSHPARVYGTQGAGVFFCPSVIRFVSGSVALTGSVQYVNADGNFVGVAPLLGSYWL